MAKERYLDINPSFHNTLDENGVLTTHIPLRDKKPPLGQSFAAASRSAARQIGPGIKKTAHFLRYKSDGTLRAQASPDAVTKTLDWLTSANALLDDKLPKNDGEGHPFSSQAQAAQDGIHSFLNSVISRILPGIGLGTPEEMETSRLKDNDFFRGLSRDQKTFLLNHARAHGSKNMEDNIAWATEDDAVYLGCRAAEELKQNITAAFKDKDNAGAGDALVAWNNKVNSAREEILGEDMDPAAPLR